MKENKDILIGLRQLAEEYQEWNCFERDDGLIIHTDAIDDFLEWLGNDIRFKCVEK